MSAHGLWKIHHAVQTSEAWKDWAQVAKRATDAGRIDLVAKYQPPLGAGWRRVDKAIEKVRAALEAEE